MRAVLLAFALTALVSPALAQAPPLKPPLDGVGFLVGDWTSDNGKVGGTGGTAVGTSHMTIEADGWMLLRRDRTQTFDAAGKPLGGFSQTMLIYAEAGGLHADYGDGEGHVIHYEKVTVKPGHSVIFTSPSGAGPAYRLAYELKSAGVLSVEFGMMAQGSGALQTIATGVLKKTP